MIVKTSLPRHCKRLTLLALFVLVSGGLPVQAASQPATVATAATQAPIHLAWDRVGSPIQIRV
ncbi:MAG: hypothetical protein PHD37_03095 [Gallionellaceae bacterium]|nr:hypothetical protein [Gallionellaceae bacterium]